MDQDVDSGRELGDPGAERSHPLDRREVARDDASVPEACQFLGRRSDLAGFAGRGENSHAALQEGLGEQPSQAPDAARHDRRLAGHGEERTEERGLVGPLPNSTGHLVDRGMGSSVCQVATAFGHRTGARRLQI